MLLFHWCFILPSMPPLAMGRYVVAAALVLSLFMALSQAHEHDHSHSHASSERYLYF